MLMGTLTRLSPEWRGAVVAAAFMAGAACTSVNSTVDSLEGSSWQVTAINGAATPASDMYRISFENGRIGGRLGCNQFGGSYHVERDRLIAEDVASTLMGCPEPAASHEALGLAVLGRPMELEWASGRHLTLRNEGGSIALEATQ